MDFQEYEAQALRTTNPEMDRSAALANIALGLAGEAGEVADMIKKHLYHGHPLDLAAYRAELGDLLWYLTWGANLLAGGLEQIGAENIRKLQKRYPNGFNHADSRNRRV